MDLEFSCLLGWLRTFPLQSQASSAADLSDGLAMSEVLVQIEPATFTPTWFAGILKSSSPGDTLNVLLNMLLHYYRHNLSEDCVTGDSLPVPSIPAPGVALPVEEVASFLKLILGVAVTCSNKLLFISKIQSLDETTQHALTACIVSFISTKDWSGKQSPIDSVSDAKASPPGDEVWAQKCHELDYQVALLREERSNLMNENEELCGKVRAAQTLSRKDSFKSRHLETELTNVKDDFERLKMEFDTTKQHVTVMEQRLKTGSRDQEDAIRMTEEINLLRSDLSKLQSSFSVREQNHKFETVSARLESHQDLIEELKTEMQIQVTLQARMSQELDTVKDQVDVLREQVHTSARFSQDIGEIKSRVSELERGQETEAGDLGPLVTQPPMLGASLDLSMTSRDSRDSVVDTEEVDFAENVSQTNKQLDETTVIPTQVQVDSPEYSLNETIGDIIELKIQHEILVASTKSDENMEESNEENTFQNEDKDVTKPEPEDKVGVKIVEVTEEPPDIDLEKNVVENIGDIQGESKEEESQRTEIEPNTEPMTNSSEDEDNREAGDTGGMDVKMPDSEVHLSTNKVTEEQQEIDLDKNIGEDIGELQLHEESEEEESHGTETEPTTQPMTSHSEEEERREEEDTEGLLKDVEEWNFSSVMTLDDRSLVEEKKQKDMIDNIFKLKRKPKKAGLSRMADDESEEGGSRDCFSSLFLQVFVKVFD